MTRVSELAREGSQMPFRERRAGFLSEFSYRYPWRLLEQRHPLATLATSKHGQIGDDDVDDIRPGERQRTLREQLRSEEHTSELQSLMRISYDVFCLKKKNNNHPTKIAPTIITIKINHVFIKKHIYCTSLNKI